MSCPDCVRDLDHCHGSLVLLPDGTVECCDPECHDTGADRHDLLVRIDR